MSNQELPNKLSMAERVRQKMIDNSKTELTIAIELWIENYPLSFLKPTYSQSTCEQIEAIK